MKQKHISVRHQGITINIKPTRSRKKNGCVYTSYQIDDYSTGERKRRTFSDIDEAKRSARALAEAKATGKRHTLDWDATTHAQVGRALDLARKMGLCLDDLCQRFFDAVEPLGGDHHLLLPAVYYYKQNAPNQILNPILVREAATSFLADHAPAIGLRRRKTNTSYLAQFGKQFGDRTLHEIQPVEIHDWTRTKQYAAKTRNDVLNLLSQFFHWALVRHYVTYDPASSRTLKRGRVKSGDIGIFTAAQARKLLDGVDDHLKPLTALWLFSGFRKDEIARLTWEQIDQGLGSGAVYARASQTKTGEARAVPLSDNLQQWLMRYREPTGLVLPIRWQGKDPKHQIQRLDDLTGHLSLKLGAWLPNAPRHSFATYHLALYKDPARTVREMGTSLVKLQEHYWARAAAVTTEQAQEWFNITPETSAVVVPLGTQAHAAVG